MTVYLAGTEGQEEIFTHSVKPWREIAMLQSYYYLRTKKAVHIPDRFLLDSGAFTFIASGEITPERFKFLPWFVKTAHAKGIRVHGLGITSADWLRKCHFDSVDSATWLVGDRFSNICRFECVKGKWSMMQKHLYGKRCKDVKALRQFNFNQWVRFQEYAETHL